MSRGKGEGCYPVQPDWECAPDASGDTGTYGEPCDTINGCDPGFACLDPNTVPPGLPCEAAAGCLGVLVLAAFRRPRREFGHVAVCPRTR